MEFGKRCGGGKNYSSAGSLFLQPARGWGAAGVAAGIGRILPPYDGGRIVPVLSGAGIGRGPARKTCPIIWKGFSLLMEPWGKQEGCEKE